MRADNARAALGGSTEQRAHLRSRDGPALHQLHTVTCARETAPREQSDSSSVMMGLSWNIARSSSRMQFFESKKPSEMKMRIACDRSMKLAPLPAHHGRSNVETHHSLATSV